MAGHSKLHPYLKSYDELKRTANRLNVYLDMHYENIPDQEKQKIMIIVEKLEQALQYIPEKYHVSRFKQFNKKEKD